MVPLGSLLLPTNDLPRLEAALAAVPDVAAVILEPSGASWGTVPLAPGFLAGVREATRRHGVLLIFDEVITGFRWAPGGAQARHGVVPDLATLGKIIAGGLPGGRYPPPGGRAGDEGGGGRAHSRLARLWRQRRRAQGRLRRLRRGLPAPT